METMIYRGGQMILLIETSVASFKPQQVSKTLWFWKDVTGSAKPF
jgi:hypothetical protein